MVACTSPPVSNPGMHPGKVHRGFKAVPYGGYNSKPKGAPICFRFFACPLAQYVLVAALLSGLERRTFNSMLVKWRF